MSEGNHAKAFCRPSYYRDTVPAYSPTLPRFAATLGMRVSYHINREAVAAFAQPWRNRPAVE